MRRNGACTGMSSSAPSMSSAKGRGKPGSGSVSQVVDHFDCNSLSSYFVGDGRVPLRLTIATDDPSFLMMYFVVIVTVPSLLLVSVRSVLLIRCPPKFSRLADQS